MLVSIIIPCFERSDELKKLLDSLKNLNFTRPYEIIVIDDGSKEPIKIEGCIRFEKNVGPAKARNVGVEKTKGNFLWFLDSDVEIKDPNLLTRMVEILEKDESLVGVGGEIIEINGKPHSLIPYHFPNWSYVPRYISIEKAFQIYPKCIATNNLLIRRKDFVGFSEWFETMEDNDLCLQMARSKKSYLIRNDTCVYHHHSAEGRKGGKFDFYNQIENYISVIHKNRIKLLYRNRRHLLPILPFYDMIFLPICFLFQIFLSKKKANILLQEKSQRPVPFLEFIFLHLKSLISSWKMGYELLVSPN